MNKKKQTKNKNISLIKLKINLKKLFKNPGFLKENYDPNLYN